MSPEEFRAGLYEALDKLEKLKPRKKVLSGSAGLYEVSLKAGELDGHGV